MALRISNRDARRLWLHAQGLSTVPTGPLDVLGTIKQLGYVQLDTLRVVARAHHHILWSRNQNYREPMLNRLLADDRAIFEHYSHDACVLPVAFYPHWRRQFRRLEALARERQWYRSMLDQAGREAIKARIATEGPLSTKAFDTKIDGARQMWHRPPHKLALDYMWYAGELSTSHRQNFTKFYDLTERVIPAHARADDRSDAAQLDWLCSGALDRLAFGTVGDIQRFWDAASLDEVKTWVGGNGRRLVEAEIEGFDGVWKTALAPPDIEVRLSRAPAPTTRLRILNPFDPVVRNRARLAHLFGFEFTIEVFVPAAKRRWGYYVYPLLEGDKFVGRAEIKGDRKAATLTVKNLWPETGVAWSRARAAKLDAELARLARLVGARDIVWATGG